MQLRRHDQLEWRGYAPRLLRLQMVGASRKSGTHTLALTGTLSTETPNVISTSCKDRRIVFPGTRRIAGRADGTVRAELLVRGLRRSLAPKPIARSGLAKEPHRPRPDPRTTRLTIYPSPAPTPDSLRPPLAPLH